MKISIVTVVFNSSATIEKTLQSVLSQITNFDFEYIVIDAQSTDGTTNIIKRYLDGIDIFVCEEDAGIYDAMNKSLKICDGEYILFMNSGDLFSSQFVLQSLHDDLNLLNKPDIIFGQWEAYSEISATNYRITPDLKKGRFNHQSVLYKKSLHDKYGYYLNIKHLTTADYFFFRYLIICRNVRCVVVDYAVALIDLNGISSGLHTSYQRKLIDILLLNNKSRVYVAFYLMFHPLYHYLKQFILFFLKSK